MTHRCDIIKRPRFCSTEILNKAIQFYDDYVRMHGLSFRQAIEHFETIAEGEVRSIFGVGRGADQRWRSCKGALYEYAVCRALDEILSSNPLLSQKIDIIHGSKLTSNSTLRNQLTIRNWSEILPDVDFVIVNKVYEKVVAVLSCKTSLRERMTETAFWSRELKPKGIEVIFITTDKDEEVTSDVNRYIVMHVLDYTVITNPDRYNKIVEEWKLKYGSRSDFNVMMSKIIDFNDIIKILQKYAS